MSRWKVAAVLLVLVLTVAPSSFACSWDCLTTYYDDNSDGTVDAISAHCLTATSSFGGRTNCRVRSICRFVGPNYVCIPYCDGEFCVVV